MFAEFHLAFQGIGEVGILQPLHSGGASWLKVGGFRLDEVAATQIVDTKGIPLILCEFQPSFQHLLQLCVSQLLAILWRCLATGFPFQARCSPLGVNARPRQPRCTPSPTHTRRLVAIVGAELRHVQLFKAHRAASRALLDLVVQDLVVSDLRLARTQSSSAQHTVDGSVQA